MRKQELIRSVGKQNLVCTFKNVVRDVDYIAGTLVVKMVKTPQRTAQNFAKIISHGEGSCFEHILCMKLVILFIFTLMQSVETGLFGKSNSVSFMHSWCVYDVVER